MIRGNWFRPMTLAVQAIALATACTAQETPPRATATTTPLAIRSAAAVASPGSVQRWTLPDLRTWDVHDEEFLYVAESDPATWHLRDLKTGSETSGTVGEGRQIVGAVILHDGVGYIAAVGADPYRPSAFEIRLHTRSTQQDQLLETVGLAVEAGQDLPLRPGLITSEDRSILVWSRSEASAETFQTELRQREAAGSSVTSVLRAEGVMFPMALSGRDLIVWKRAAGVGDSYEATDTYVIADGQERLLLKGAFPVDVAADGRVVIHRGATAEIRAGLTGAVLMELSLGSQGPGVNFPPAIAGRRIAWCSEQGIVSVVELDSRTSQRYTAKGCASRIYLDDSTVTWLEAVPGKFALVRLQLP